MFTQQNILDVDCGAKGRTLKNSRKKRRKAQLAHKYVFQQNFNALTIWATNQESDIFLHKNYLFVGRETPADIT